MKSRVNNIRTRRRLVLPLAGHARRGGPRAQRDAAHVPLMMIMIKMIIVVMIMIIIMISRMILLLIMITIILPIIMIIMRCLMPDRQRFTPYREVAHKNMPITLEA